MKALPVVYYFALYFSTLMWHSYVFAQDTVSYQISGDMVISGDVEFYELSPDGLYAVYLADQRMDGVRELFSVPVSGGEAIRLNADLTSGGDIPFANFQISADSTRVVYLADQNTDNVYELFSVSITGGTVTRLNPDLVSGGDAINGNFQISADSAHVIYLADQINDGEMDLFSVPIDGGMSIRLNEDTVNGGDELNSFAVSADSARVVYLADQNTAGVDELFSVAITGGDIMRLNSDLVSGGNVFSEFAISADSQHVIYVADQNIDSVDEIFTVPVAGGQALRLKPGLWMTMGMSNPAAFKITPDSTRVIYLADQNGTGAIELFSVPIASGPAIRLNPDLVSGGDVFQGFEISADSARVIYIATQLVASQFELFSVAVTGGPAVRLNPAFAPGQSVSGGFKISADSARVVFLATLFNPTRDEVYSVPVAGGTVTLITPALVSDTARYKDIQISPDSATVMMLTSEILGETAELFSVPIAGGATTSLNTDLPLSSNVNQFQISPDGIFVVYLADQNVTGQKELFARDLEETDLADETDDLCFPVSASNGNIAVVCIKS